MIITRAPFRIPLGGGGTDLPSYYGQFGGSLISVAINKYMLLTVNRPVVDKLIRVKYAKSETVDHVDQVEHELVREALKLTNISDSIEISSIADVPSGTGMGSSGSYLVALLKALHTFKREEVTAKQIAEEACLIEIEKLKSPVGKQDQYMAAIGGLTKLEIDKKGNVEVVKPNVDPGILKDLENSLVIFYTGIRRESKEVLTKQNASTTQGDKQVIESLHYIKEIGHEIFKAITKGNISKFGALMDEHWQHKRKLASNVSSTQIDHWYQEGKYAGALGGKIMGAGGGGFLMFCCPGDKTTLRASMAKNGLTEMFFSFDTEGVKTMVDF